MQTSQTLVTVEHSSVHYTISNWLHLSIHNAKKDNLFFKKPKIDNINNTADANVIDTGHVEDLTVTTSEIE